MFKEISIKDGSKELKGHMYFGKHVKAWIIFSHGSGSSRKSKRNNWVAEELVKDGFGALLFDLLTPEEDEIYQNRFDIKRLKDRLLKATSWLVQSEYYQGEKIAYFGASTGAAAALSAAANAEPSLPIYTVVSRGGRPDLIPEEDFITLSMPVLLIVGSQDTEVIKLNQWAKNQLMDAELVLVPRATHLFEEEGTLEEVVRHTSLWLTRHLPHDKGLRFESFDFFT